MNEWLLLVGAKGLKTVIVGGLSALSFGVDVLSKVTDGIQCHEDRSVVVVVRQGEPIAAQAFAWNSEGAVLRMACMEEPMACVEEPWARIVARKVKDVSRPDILVQLGALVPPILVEALFPPDLLLPHPAIAEPPVAVRVEVPKPPARPRA